jgi:RNA polymerase sigma factor (sigma-70 family)
MTEPPENSDVFSRLFTETRATLRRYVRRLVSTKEVAEDVVQEAFLRTYERGSSVQEPRAFLFATAHNLASDHRRHERTAGLVHARESADPQRESSGLTPEDLLIDDEASRLLREAVGLLPPQCQVALTLKVFHGQTYNEIAARLGLSPRTVEKHVATGLRRTHVYLRTRYLESKAGDGHG